MRQSFEAGPTSPQRGVFPHAVAALLVLLAGLASGLAAQSGFGNAWFDGLQKPWFMPPRWLFPVAWTILYLLLGIVLGDLLVLRGARDRGLALTLFAAQLALNLGWSPLFFGARQPLAALMLILALDVTVLATLAVTARVRRRTAALLLPYCAWLVLATALNAAIVRLN